MKKKYRKLIILIFVTFLFTTSLLSQKINDFKQTWRYCTPGVTIEDLKTIIDLVSPEAYQFEDMIFFDAPLTGFSNYATYTCFIEDDVISSTNIQYTVKGVDNTSVLDSAFENFVKIMLTFYGEPELNGLGKDNLYIWSNIKLNSYSENCDLSVSKNDSNSSFLMRLY